MTKVLNLSLMLVTLMATTNPVPAQSQTQTPTDPTLAVLQLQQQQLAAQQGALDARLKIQQDQQNMLTGALPSSSTAPNSGAFTVSGSTPFPSQKLAYESLVALAVKISGRLIPPAKDSNGKTLDPDAVKTDLIDKLPVVIYDQNEINSLINYKAVMKVLVALQTQVTNLQKQFNDNLDKEAKRLLHTDITATLTSPAASKSFAGILAPGLVLGGLKTVSDLLGMFRTNTSIAFSSFTPDDIALAAVVVQQLQNNGKSVSLPATMPLAVLDDSSLFMDQVSLVQTTILNLQDGVTLDQSLVQQLSDALAAFIQADQALAVNTDQTKVATLTSARSTAQQFAAGLLGTAPGASLDVAKAGSLKAQCDQFIKSISGFTAGVTSMATTFGAFQTSLTAVSSAGAATLTAILRAEKLMNKVKGGAAILTVKTSVLAGSVVTKTNLFRGGTLLFTGGAIATYTLFNTDGAVLASGLVINESNEVKRTL